MGFWNRIFRRSNDIEIMALSKREREAADLKDILVGAAQEVMQEQQAEREKRRRAILNDDKLPIYFKRIWSLLQTHSGEGDGANAYSGVLISAVSIKCPCDDFDTIFSFFSLACKDAGIGLSFSKSSSNWRVDNCLDIRRALTKINQSMDDETRLQLTQGVYR